MESIIVLGGGEGPIIVFRDGKIVIIHPEGPGQELHALVGVLRAAVSIEETGVRNGVAELVGRSIEANLVGQQELAAV
jgi:hypothetical protein